MAEPVPNDDDVAAALNWLTQVDRPILQNAFAAHREAAYATGLLAGAKAMQEAVAKLFEDSDMASTAANIRDKFYIDAEQIIRDIT